MTEQPQAPTMMSSRSPSPSLSVFQWTQILLLASCYSMAFSSVTLLMSKAPLIVTSTGGKDSLGPVSIALYEIGKCFVVLPVGSAIRKFCRKIVFFAGGLFGLVSSGLGILGVKYAEPCFILLSTFCAGIPSGIAYGYRFAAIEVAPAHRELAVTTCLSGGILGAVMGPVSATYSKHLFAINYLGVYMVNSMFVSIMLCLTAVLKLDSDNTTSPTTPDMSSPYETTSRINPSQLKAWTLRRLFGNQTFVYGCLASTMSWVCMNLPMSVLGLAMEDVSLSDLNVLLAFIMHFMGMFAPGLVTCRLIEWFGFSLVDLLSVFAFVVATTLDLLINRTSGASLWIVGQLFVGMGWNLGFSSATVMVSTCCPAEDRKAATVIQAHNDFISFLVDGLLTISSGYTYKARGGGVSGWKFLNYILILFVGIKLFVLIFASSSYNHDRHKNNGLTCELVAVAGDKYTESQ